MRRYFKYILAVALSSLFAVSCLEEMEAPQPVLESDVLTLVPRVTSFANQYVTKAEGDNLYSTAEKKITSLALLVFDSEGALVHIEEATGASNLTLNKSMLNIEGATLVMFANADIAALKSATNLTITSLETYSLGNLTPVVTEANISATDFKGLPMMGRLEGVDLTATATSQGPLAVSLKILYAKVNFTVGVAQGTENQGTGAFTMNSLSVYNAALATNIASETVADNSSTYTESGTAVAKKTNGTYTFYVSENRYNPGESLNGIYPSDDWLTEDPTMDVKGYSGEADNYKLNGVKYFYDDLIQQYKPKLATKGAGQATYALLNGVYTDYRGTAWNVDYKIYLGKDNAQNFEVDRNSEYTNSVTIKGIRNNDSYGAGDVWIDHRVNVSTNDLSGNVTITRETLIDSHIEVRPLRVTLNPNQYSGARLYAPNVNWIGVERFTGKNCQDGSVYCYKGGQSIGKRKYFTTTLIPELKGIVGDSGYISLMDGECAWIYFDENTGAADRTAEIKVEFFNTEGNSVGSETYTIVQRGLQTVGNYALESYEEYLHTYDSADKYNLSTSPIDYTQQGLAWGLANNSVSYNQMASMTVLPALNLYANTTLVKDVRYDFLHVSDGQFNIYSGSNSWGAISADAKNLETGLHFTDRATKHVDGVKDGITIQDMGTLPANAYQYCLSKNKFHEDANGNHTLDIHWYLPDVYELETVLKTDNVSSDFKQDAYYWSSQPAYTDRLNSDALDYLAGIFGGEVAIVDEDVEQARAASKSSTKGVNLARMDKNRIRCFYSAEGVKNVDMSNRVPDGMGGIFNFWMKGWTDGGKNTAGFFNYLLPAPPEPTGDTQTSTVPDVTIPTKANSQSASAEFPYIVTEGKNGQIEGFQVNPGDKNNWSKYSLSSTHYYTLRDYPGLSDYTLDKATLTDAYEETSTRKSITQTSLKTSTVEKTQSLPSSFALNPLNEKLTIAFDQCDGSSVPVFTYDELYSQVKTTSTQYWNKPLYTGTTYELTPQSETPSSTGTGSETGVSTGTSSLQQASESDAKKVAFDGTQTTSTLTCWVDGAYPKAKNDAKGKLDELLKNYPTTDGWVHGTYEYTQLSWNQQVSNIKWSNLKTETKKGLFSSYTSKVTITCTVTVTGSVIVTKPGSKTLYLQVEGTGNWSPATTTTESSGPTVNTDQLRVYCGNSLTISVNAANANDYVISKVKVHISGGNRIKNVPVSSELTTDNYYARFVDSTLIPTGRGQIAYAEQGMFDYGTGEYIVLQGMEYSGDSTDSDIWQQWTGNDSSVTLVLTDYKVSTRAGFNAKYTYQTADTDKSKYIIIDRIEVKCTKKAAATTE